jgi:hypothetical protein
LTLLVDELQSSLYQEVTATKNFDLVAIRPHLYKHRNPSGNLTVELQDGNGELILASDVVNISAISAANFFHGYIRFDLIKPILEGQVYRIALIPGGGYSFSENAYIGWCRDYDLRKYTATYSPNTGHASALDFEAWERREI